jgi:hypothetical protein
MLLTLVIVGGVLLLTAVAWVIRLNYSSEALLSNGLTAAAVGIAGLLASLWFSLKSPEPREYRFPVVFVIDRATRLPLSVMEYPAVARYADPGWGAPGVAGKAPFLSGLTKKALPALKPDDNQGLNDVYLDVLVSYAMDVLGSTFRNTWDADVVSFELAHLGSARFGSREPLRKGAVFQRRELVNDLPHPEILRDGEAFAPTFTAPPRTSVVWTAKTEPLVARVLELSNPFAKVAVAIERQGWSVGSGGVAPLAGISSIEESQERTLTLSYEMKLTATFERLRSGHPDMPAHVRWVDTLFGQLRQFDSEQRWRSVKQDYALLRDQQEWLRQSFAPRGQGPAKRD